MATVPVSAPALTISPIASESIIVPVVGTAPLIVHAWSEKAKRQMLDAQQGRKAPREFRDPEADYEASLYRTESGYGFPAVAFKAATVGAARFFGKALRMTQVRQFVFLSGVPSDDKRQILTSITGTPRMREDMVTVGVNGTDLRYRAEFPDWTAALKITFITTALSRDSVVSLIEAGGMGVGVGEWRPEKDGMHGTYAIDTTRDVEVVR